MDYSTVLSSATKLKRNSLYKVTIAENTLEALLQLNSMIMRSHDAGLTKIEFKLPINFQRVDDTVTNEELQTAIYFNIVSELERKDYDVKILFHTLYTILTVSWSVKAEDSEVARMKTKLMSLCKKNR